MSKASDSFVLYSDGGAGIGASVAAAACILECKSSGKRISAAAYMGEATNNEAELLGGLLGFSLLHAYFPKAVKHAEVTWVCDSEYLLKGATNYIQNWQKNGWKTADKKPVKNQGFWRAFLELSQGMKITASHVRGHTGHVENEACDAAVQYAKEWGESEPDISENGMLFSIAGTDEEWLLFDLRDYLVVLRDEDSQAEDYRMLVEILPAEIAPAQKKEKHKSSNDDSELIAELGEEITKKLREAYKVAKTAAKKSGKFLGVAAEIEQVARRIKSL